MKLNPSVNCCRAIKALALWLGLAALMVQSVAPLCAPALMGGPSGGVASIVICTAHGSETVQIGADGTPLPHPPAHSFSDCCTACHAPGGFNVASPIPVAAPSGIASEGARFEPVSVVATRFYSSYVTRGPPRLS
jgi:hypothetical protein